MPVNFRRRVSIVVAAALGWLTFQGVAPANANTITFELDSVFGGATPHGSLPWVTAIFTDKGPNAVRLTLAASGLSGHEFLGKGGFLFNLDPFPRHLKANTSVARTANSHSGETGSSRSAGGRSMQCFHSRAIKA